jgi:hypothetical protein
MKLTTNLILAMTCFGLFMGAAVTGSMYLEGEKLIAQDNKMDYEMLSSFNACVALENLSIEECETIHKG